jgi:hypothetical protein
MTEFSHAAVNRERTPVSPVNPSIHICGIPRFIWGLLCVFYIFANYFNLRLALYFRPFC